MELDRVREMQCPCCGEVKSKLSFYPSLNKTKAVLPLCKECIKSKYESVLANTKSPDAALWSVCMQLDLPMLSDVYNATRVKMDVTNGKGRRPSYFLIYYDTLKELGVKFNGAHDSDMVLSDFIQIKGEPDENEADANARREAWDKVWGKNYTDEQCMSLDEYYFNYTNDLFDMDTAQVLRYRDLCKCELRKFEGDDSKENTTELTNLMKMLKLDNFKDNKRDEMEKHIERQIWMIENTKPSECEDLHKYEDISGFKEAYQHIMRGMRNLIAGSRQYPSIPKDEE